MSEMKLDTCAVVNGGPWRACEHDRIEPNWAIDLREETDLQGPFALYTGAYSQSELDKLPKDRVAMLIDDLRDIRAHYDSNINGGDFPLASYASGANDCERNHLAMYEHDMAVLEKLLLR
jgi:hypothetical protein